MTIKRKDIIDVYLGPRSQPTPAVVLNIDGPRYVAMIPDFGLVHGNLENVRKHSGELDAQERRHFEANVWANTHNDYKLRKDGKRWILMNTSKGTSLVPLSTLSDKQLAERVGVG